MSDGRFKRYQWVALIGGGLGLLAAAVGAVLNWDQFWQSYLLGYIFWLEIGLGCLGLVMLHHLVGGRWSALIRRVVESGAMTLPFMAVLFLPLLAGLTSLYSWTDATQVSQSELLQHKSAYLNIPFFIIRAALYFAIWAGLAYGLNRWSLAQDQANAVALAGRLRRLSAIGMILYILSATFAAIDWLMSLEPEWFSSIYGLQFLAGQALAGLALAIIGLAYWISRDPATPASAVTGAFNDLGNFLLGFVMIWAYFSFSQFLIIWTANLPEEGIWYYHRSQGGWQVVGMFLVVVHFALPFLLLLSRTVKRRAQLLTLLALLIFMVRLADLFWLIGPAFHPAGFQLHWLDIVLPIAIGGGWVAVFFRQLAGKPLLPQYDPHLVEVDTHEQTKLVTP
jgi:hypothetical protein